MRKILGYIVIEESSALNIAQAVNDAIKRGWQPLGQPFSSPVHPMAYAQALVLYENNE